MGTKHLVLKRGRPATMTFNRKLWGLSHASDASGAVSPCDHFSRCRRFLCLRNIGNVWEGVWSPASVCSGFKKVFSAWLKDISAQWSKLLEWTVQACSVMSCWFTALIWSEHLLRIDNSRFARRTTPSPADTRSLCQARCRIHHLPILEHRGHSTCWRNDRNLTNSVPIITYVDVSLIGQPRCFALQLLYLQASHCLVTSDAAVPWPNCWLADSISGPIWPG